MTVKARSDLLVLRSGTFQGRHVIAASCLDSSIYLLDEQSSRVLRIEYCCVPVS